MKNLNQMLNFVGIKMQLETLRPAHRLWILLSTGMQILRSVAPKKIIYYRSITGPVTPCSLSTRFNKLPCANLFSPLKSTIGPLALDPSMTPRPLVPSPQPPWDFASRPSPVNAEPLTASWLAAARAVVGRAVAGRRWEADGRRPRWKSAPERELERCFVRSWVCVWLRPRQSVEDGIPSASSGDVAASIRPPGPIFSGW